MKFVMGPTEMKFNGTQSPILDKTVEIINDYNKRMFDINQWAKNEQAKIEQQHKEKLVRLTADVEGALARLQK